MEVYPITAKKDWKQKQADLKEQITDAIDELANQTEKARISEEMQKHLQLMSKFHKYSYHNILLILCQQPTASLVAGCTPQKVVRINKWKKLN